MYVLVFIWGASIGSLITSYVIRRALRDGR